MTRICLLATLEKSLPRCQLRRRRAITRSRHSTGDDPVAPWHAAVCATMSRRPGSCPGPECAAAQGHWLPCFCAVTHQMARNHKTSGFRVSWKIVPAVSDTWYPQPAQTSRLRLVIQLEVPRQRGQTKPSGPTQLKQVFSTRSFSPKSGLQFGQRSGVPLQRPLPQHIGLLDSTKYPESGIWTLRDEGRNR